MLNKLHKSVIALTLLLGLVGTPKVVNSLEIKNIVETKIAQADGGEIAPETTEESQGISWYWLLLLLIPLGLGGLLLARRDRSSVEVREKERVHPTSTANTPIAATNNNLSALDSNQVVNSNRTSGSTATANRIEDETILTTGFDAYDIVGNSKTKDRNDVKDRENHGSSVDRVARTTENKHTEANNLLFDLESTPSNQDTIDTDEISFASENSISGAETSTTSTDEISLEEITFDDEPTLDESKDDEINDWLESFNRTESDSDLEDISEWLNSFDDAEPTYSKDRSAKTAFNNNNYTNSDSIDETQYTSDDAAFKELYDLLDEDSNRSRER